MTTMVYFLPMARVLLVVYDGVQTLDAAGPGEVFAAASMLVGREIYRVQAVSVGGGVRRTGSSIFGIPTRDLRRVRVRPSDTILVAGADEPAIRAAMADAALRRWLASAARVARRTTSVCSGAFILAAAGVLDGRRAATHWLGCKQLAAMFPTVTVDANAIFVQDGRVWTSAGVTTGIDMALAIVEQDVDRETADAIAARLVLYFRRPGYQSQFSEALVAQGDASDPLGPAIAWARAHLGDADVETLARRAGLSVRTLHRRCLDLLSTTPARLLDKLRVEQARALLSSSALPAKTLAVQCGFGNPARMRRAFSRELGLDPTEYRALHSSGSRTPREPMAAPAPERARSAPVRPPRRPDCGPPASPRRAPDPRRRRAHRRRRGRRASPRRC
jgi:transcriptional regulator GlxA family with amidase domain